MDHGSGTGTGYDHAITVGIKYGVTLARIKFLLVIYHIILYSLIPSVFIIPQSKWTSIIPSK